MVKLRSKNCSFLYQKRVRSDNSVRSIDMRLVWEKYKESTNEEGELYYSILFFLPSCFLLGINSDAMLFYVTCIEFCLQWLDCDFDGNLRHTQTQLIFSIDYVSCLNTQSECHASQDALRWIPPFQENISMILNLDWLQGTYCSIFILSFMCNSNCFMVCRHCLASAVLSQKSLVHTSSQMFLSLFQRKWLSVHLLSTCLTGILYCSSFLMKREHFLKKMTMLSSPETEYEWQWNFAVNLFRCQRWRKWRNALHIEEVLFRSLNTWWDHFQR
jgi:hypothetical protein